MGEKRIQRAKPRRSEAPSLAVLNGKLAPLSQSTVALEDDRFLIVFAENSLGLSEIHPKLTLWVDQVSRLIENVDGSREGGSLGPAPLEYAVLKSEDRLLCLNFHQRLPLSDRLQEQAEYLTDLPKVNPTPVPA